MVGDLVVDPVDQPGPDPVRRDQQPPVRRLLRHPGEVVEQPADVVGDDRVGGQQADVLVQPGRLRVVVAGADVGIATQTVRLVADHQGQLAVRLQPDDAVDDVAAVLLQPARPGDVGLLVEAGLDLDQDEHLLAGLGRVDQGVDDRGVAGRAVERLLDGQHLRVVGGLLEEALDAGGEASRTGGAAARRAGSAAANMSAGLRGLDLRQVRVGRAAGRLGTSARPGRGRPARTGRAGRAGRAARNTSLLGDVELGDQQVEHLRVDVVLDLEPDRRRPNRRRSSSRSRASSRFSASSSSTSTSSLRVTRKTWCWTTSMPGNSCPRCCGDDVLERDEPPPRPAGRTGTARSAPSPGRTARAPVSRVADQHREVERQPGDVRERVRRVDGQRGQHGEDPLGEELVAAGAFGIASARPSGGSRSLRPPSPAGSRRRTPGRRRPPARGCGPGSRRAPRAASSRTRSARRRRPRSVASGRRPGP